MLISCPNCSTNFTVPDHALGAKGRTLKCAKCGHKWFQAVARPEDELDLDLDGPSLAPSFAEPERDDRPQFRAPEPEPRLGGGGRPPADFDIDLDEPPIPDFGARVPPEKAAPVSDLLDEAPQPIPDVFASSAQPEKKGTGGLWLLLLVLLLAGLGGGVYYFQDKVVELVPEAGDVLAQLGLRTEKPGAGLQLRSAGTPERFVHNDTEVLIVRGIIANVTDRPRPVPTMKLVLLDKNKQTVQEKLSQPPVTSLEPQGTASFKIMLDRPDPNAVEVNVVFVEGEGK